ncbi:MAG: peptide chain release factor-like protein [Desulfobacca sp.]|nr:peptide chain release factor-like protein [Desulfobacca sp.]
MAISPEKQKMLQEALRRLGLREEDVLERFIRSGGSGGQKVNKTSTAVYLKHMPTGLEVKMQKERSQALNRFLAWRLLAEKMEALQGGNTLQGQQLEKIRKQKDRRLRRAKKIAKQPIGE